MRYALALLLSIPMQAQWQVQQSNTTADLRGIHSIGSGVAWASGSKGTVLRTTDNGANWQTCAVPPNAETLDFRGIQAFDAQTAVVMSSGKGDLSRLYKTTDACKTWKLVFTNPDADGFWDAVSLQRHPTGEVTGWLLGDPVNSQFTVFSIYDGSPGNGMPPAFCAVRDQSLSLAANSEVTGAFAASNSALFHLITGDSTSTNQSQVFFVTGGSSGSQIYQRLPLSAGDVTFPLQWDSRPLPLGSMTPASGAFSVAFASRWDGVAVGGDYTKPESSGGTAAYWGTGFAEYWSPAESLPHGYRSAVAAIPNRNGVWITVGPNGTDLSTDKGHHWRRLTPGHSGNPDEDKQWNALSLPFVVGPKGRIGILRPDALGKP